MREVLQPQDANVYTSGRVSTKQAADDPLREWRAKWREILKQSCIYFDSIPPHLVEYLKPHIVELGSTIQPFFDQNVTHVISENHSSEVCCKARDLHSKVYTLEKMARFLSSLSGRSLVLPTGEQGPKSQVKLAAMLETDAIAANSNSRQSDFHQMRGPYVLVYDPISVYRPSCIKEWKYNQTWEEGDWPQLRKAVNGMSPFAALAHIKTEKRRYDARMREQERAAVAEKRPLVAPYLDETDEHNDDHENAGTNKENGNGDEHRKKHLDDDTPMEEEDSSKKRRFDNKENIPHGSGPIVQPSAPAAHSSQSILGVKNSASQSQSQSQPQPQPQSQSQSQSQSHSSVHSRNRSAHGVLSAAATPSVRLREFGEIVASGVPRYSQTSKLGAKDSTQSRELAQLRRKVMPQPVLVDANRSLTHAVPAPVRTKPVPKKPGWCENCLERYDDLLVHVVSSSHRNFAANDQKFAALDAVIAQLQRPAPSQTNSNEATAQSSFAEDFEEHYDLPSRQEEVN